MIIKTWELGKSLFDENDLRWCRSLDITLHVDTGTKDFIIAGSASNFKVMGRFIVTLCTITEKQEAALLLKYGQDIYLIEEKIIDVKI